MKIVFMGTPDFAVEALAAILEAGHQVAAVVTQPDKPKGRGGRVQMSPVKECALRNQLPVFQPVKIKAPEAVEQLGQYQADLYVVAAFGQILSREILTMPRFGCVNIHASLLPRYRGAAPIQWAVINGDAVSGVTIMQMDAGLDTGDILLQREIALSPEETGESLYGKLSRLGAELIVETIPLIEQGRLSPLPQEGGTCYAKMLTKDMGEIRWEQDSAVLERWIRGLNSWPSAYTYYQGRILKIWSSRIVSPEEEQALSGNRQPERIPGAIAVLGKNSFYVQTGSGLLEIKEVQPEGKKRMAVRDFLLGNALPVGTVLGENGRGR